MIICSHHQDDFNTTSLTIYSPFDGFIQGPISQAIANPWLAAPIKTRCLKVTQIVSFVCQDDAVEVIELHIRVVGHEVFFKHTLKVRIMAKNVRTQTSRFYYRFFCCCHSKWILVVLLSTKRITRSNRRTKSDNFYVWLTENIAFRSRPPSALTAFAVRLLKEMTAIYAMLKIIIDSWKIPFSFVKG